MGDGIWHTTVPITDEHVFLHLLRSVYMHHKGLEKRFPDFDATLFATHLIEWNRVPSSYVIVERKRPAWFKFPRWYVVPTTLGLFYCNYVYTQTNKIDCDKYGFFYKRDSNGREKIPNAAIRYREIIPVLLHNGGFSSRADYLVKWSIFKGALKWESAPLSLGHMLNIFDDLSEGIPSKKEADRTVCMPVEELI
jgi:hypothetical protein